MNANQSSSNDQREQNQAASGSQDTSTGLLYPWSPGFPGWESTDAIDRWLKANGVKDTRSWFNAWLDFGTDRDR